MDAWKGEFNQRPRAERDQVLGPTAYPPEAMGKRPPFLPVTLPTDDELEQALTRAPFLYQLIGLVDYIGKGKALTQTGNLKLADGMELVEVLRTGDRVDEWIGDRQFKTRSSADLGGLDLVFQVAIDAKLLKRPRTGNKVVPGPKAHLARQPTLKLADAAFRSLIFDVCPSRHLNRIDPYGFGWFAESLDEQLPDMLLYHCGEQNDEVSEVSSGGQEVSGGWVEMDVLGGWLVNRLAAEGAEAPVIGGVRYFGGPPLPGGAPAVPGAGGRGGIGSTAHTRGERRRPAAGRAHARTGPASGAS